MSENRPILPPDAGLAEIILFEADFRTSGLTPADRLLFWRALRDAARERVANSWHQCHPSGKSVRSIG